MEIAVEYKKAISNNEVIPKGSENAAVEVEDPSASSSTSIQKKHSSSSTPDFVRYYTCPLDQIRQDMQQGTTKDGNDETVNVSSAGESFARIYTDREGQELVFSPSVFEMMNLFSQAVYKVGLDVEPDLHDERIPMVSNIFYLARSITQL